MLSAVGWGRCGINLLVAVLLVLPAVPAAGEEAQPEAERKEPDRILGGQIFASALGKEGNVDEVSVSAGANVTCERKGIDKIAFDSLYTYTESADIVTARSFYAEAQYDYLVYKERWYLYASEMWLTDSFKDLDGRSVSSIGIGYCRVKNKRLELSSEVGASFTVEGFDEDDDSDRDFWGGRAAGNLKWTPGDVMTLTNSVVYVRSFEAGNDYTIRNEAYLDLQFTPSWSMRLGHIYEFDNTPAVDAEKTDQTFIVAAKFAFGARVKK